MEKLTLSLLLGNEFFKLAVLIEENALTGRSERLISRRVAERIPRICPELCGDLGELHTSLERNFVSRKEVGGDLIDHLVCIARIAKANSLQTPIGPLDRFFHCPVIGLRRCPPFL